MYALKSPNRHQKSLKTHTTMEPPLYLLKGCTACRGDIVLEKKDIRCLQCGRTPPWAFTPLKPGKRRKEWVRKWKEWEETEAESA